uniref:Uncharacterized protein n=1 Tax=Rhizophora mucronata TaxID=61149 RepID=A0A2P2NKI7_RHIMU
MVSFHNLFNCYFQFAICFIYLFDSAHYHERNCNLDG